MQKVTRRAGRWDYKQSRWPYTHSDYHNTVVLVFGSCNKSTDDSFHTQTTYKILLPLYSWWGSVPGSFQIQHWAPDEGELLHSVFMSIYRRKSWTKTRWLIIEHTYIAQGMPRSAIMLASSKIRTCPSCSYCELYVNDMIWIASQNHGLGYVVWYVYMYIYTRTHE